MDIIESALEKDPIINYFKEIRTTMQKENNIQGEIEKLREQLQKEQEENKI